MVVVVVIIDLMNVTEVNENPEGVKKEGCKQHSPEAQHSTEECHKNPENMKPAANKKNYTCRDDSHHVDA